MKSAENKKAASNSGKPLDEADAYRTSEDGRYRYRPDSSRERYALLFVPLWLTLATALTQHILFFPTGDAGFGFGHLLFALFYLVTDFPGGLLALASPAGFSFGVVALLLLCLYWLGKAGGWLPRAQQVLITVDILAWAHMGWPVLCRYMGG